MRVHLLGALAVVVAVAPADAHAQASDVDALIALVERQPAGMDRQTWKEQRRAAAKKLGASGDRRAVPVLIEVVKAETFDIIGEIAIDALGQLGDPAAVPVLQDVAGDASRDVTQRDAARRALKKLGADASAAGGGATGATGDGTATGDGATGDGTATDDGAIGLLGGEPTGAAAATVDPEGVPSGPSFAADTLGATERLTFALGSASAAWDSVRERLDVALDVAGRYDRTLDRQHAAHRYGVDAAALTALVNPEGAANQRLLVVSGGGYAEYRGYARGGGYVVGRAAARLELSRLSTDDGMGNDNADRWLGLDLQAAVGGGWGRVLDVGARLRVQRLARVLEARRALGRPIDDAVAGRLQRAWWALRGELGAHRRLTATVAILREAGVLLGEPDASTTYELLQVLTDGALDGRARGVDVRLLLSEGYLMRSRSPDDEATGAPDGRLEQVLVEARYARQLSDESDVVAAGFARYRALAPDGQPAPWAIGARGTWRKFVYGDHLDPTGAVEVGASFGLSDDDLDGNSPGMLVGGELGWTMILSRASSIRLAGTATLASGELFLGVTAEAAYGLLDVAFAAE